MNWREPQNKMQKLIKILREQIEKDYNELVKPFEEEHLFKYIDEFLSSPDNSDLEKAFYLLLNQFPGYTPLGYFVIPHERVLVKNIYDPGPDTWQMEYEIDFAIYSGSKNAPVKIAIECDGLRSHSEKYNERDKMKDILLQSAGWLVMRFGSREIHKELEAFGKEENHTSQIFYKIESVIKNIMNIITTENYGNDGIRSLLTGYKWGSVICPKCKDSQTDRLNSKEGITCRHCGHKFSLKKN